MYMSNMHEYVGGFVRLFGFKVDLTVNCWFCNQNTVVPYDNRNCWDCPHCDQYNGFTKVSEPFDNRNCWDCPHCDQYNGFTKVGEYNKPIPAQGEENMNFPVGCEKEEPFESRQVLCDACNTNQQVKVYLMGNFEASSEEKFEEEYEQFKTSLEQKYKLCRQCQLKARQIVQQQNIQLLDQVIKYRSQNHMRRSSAENKPRCTLLLVLWGLSVILLLVSSTHNALAKSDLAQGHWARPERYCSRPVSQTISALYSYAPLLVFLGLLLQLAFVYLRSLRRVYILASSFVLWTAMFLLHLPYAAKIVKPQTVYILQASLLLPVAASFIISVISNPQRTVSKRRRKDDKDRINFSSTSSPSLSIYSTSSPERSDMAADAPSPGNSAPSSPASSSAEPDSTSPQRTTHKDWLHKLDSMSLCGRSAEPLPARKGDLASLFCGPDPREAPQRPNYVSFPLSFSLDHQEAPPTPLFSSSPLQNNSFRPTSVSSPIISPGRFQAPKKNLFLAPSFAMQGFHQHSGSVFGSKSHIGSTHSSRDSGLGSHWSRHSARSAFMPPQQRAFSENGGGNRNAFYTLHHLTPPPSQQGLRRRGSRSMSMRDADRESSEHSRGSTQCPVSTTQSSGGVDVSGVKSDLIDVRRQVTTVQVLLMASIGINALLVVYFIVEKFV